MGCVGYFCLKGRPLFYGDEDTVDRHHPLCCDRVCMHVYVCNINSYPCMYVLYVCMYICMYVNFYMRVLCQRSNLHEIFLVTVCVCMYVCMYSVCMYAL